MKWRHYLILIRFLRFALLLPLINCTLLFSNPPEIEYFDTRSALLTIVGLSNHFLFSSGESATSTPPDAVNPLNPENSTVKAPVPIPNDLPGLYMYSGNYKQITFTTEPGFFVVYTYNSNTPPNDPICLGEQPGQPEPIPIYSSPNPWYIKAIACRTGYEDSDIFMGEYLLTGKITNPEITIEVIEQNTYEVTMNANATEYDPPPESQTICYGIDSNPSCGGVDGSNGVCSLGTNYTTPFTVGAGYTVYAISCHINYRQSNPKSWTAP